MKEKTIAEVFEEERSLLIQVHRSYEAYTSHEYKASSTSLVRYDRHHGCRNKQHCSFLDGNNIG